MRCKALLLSIPLALALGLNDCNAELKIVNSASGAEEDDGSAELSFRKAFAADKTKYDINDIAYVEQRSTRALQAWHIAPIIGTGPRKTLLFSAPSIVLKELR